MNKIQWGAVNVFNLWLFLAIRGCFFFYFQGVRVRVVHSSIKLRYCQYCQCHLWQYYLGCVLKKIQMKPRRSQQSSCVCCSLEWLPPRRHLFAYEPSGNNSKSPHLLCKMNSVPLTHNPHTDRLCLSCRLPLAATRRSHKDVIRWWVGYPNPNLKKNPLNLTFILTDHWSGSPGEWTEAWGGNYPQTVHSANMPN